MKLLEARIIGNQLTTRHRLQSNKLLYMTLAIVDSISSGRFNIEQNLIG